MWISCESLNILDSDCNNWTLDKNSANVFGSFNEGWLDKDILILMSESFIHDFYKSSMQSELSWIFFKSTIIIFLFTKYYSPKILPNDDFELKMWWINYKKKDNCTLRHARQTHRCISVYCEWNFFDRRISWY